MRRNRNRGEAMSAIRKADTITTAVMEPLYEGGYIERDIKKCAYQCLGCGLVWPMKHQARDCESRNHVDHFSVRYVTGPIINGVPKFERWYPRDALRRDPLPEETLPEPSHDEAAEQAAFKEACRQADLAFLYGTYRKLAAERDELDRRMATALADIETLGGELPPDDEE